MHLFKLCPNKAELCKDWTSKARQFFTSVEIILFSIFHSFIFLLEFFFLGSPMRHMSPGTPPNDDFDLGGSLSPEVKYVTCFIASVTGLET